MSSPVALSTSIGWPGGGGGGTDGLKVSGTGTTGTTGTSRGNSGMGCGTVAVHSDWTIGTTVVEVCAAAAAMRIGAV